MTSSQYTFGDTDLASARLELVAKVFEPPSREFLAEHRLERCWLAVDLGCGPGHTTQLVADVLGAERAVGLDISPRFIALAAARVRSPRVEFAVHDTTVVPFPTGPADVVYARLLLAHLPDPDAVVARWLTQVAPGGRLLLDEIEWIRMTNPVLQRYEEIVVALVASGGGLMYAGPRLNGLDGVVGDRVQTYPVSTADAAAMFRMNLEVWRHDKFIRANFAARDIDELAAALEELAASRATDEIVWGLRQVALTRRA